METKGYTLVELIVVSFLIGLLAAVGVPTWLSFLQRQKIRRAASQLHSALLGAKSEAAKHSVRYAVTVCSPRLEVRRDEEIWYSIHPYSQPPSQFTTMSHVSLVKSTVRRSPTRYRLSSLGVSDCYTTYLGLFPSDGYDLGFFYLSGGKGRYIYRVGFNTLIGNIVSCPVLSLEASKCR